MGILTWIVVGLIAGWLAGVLMRGSGYGIVGNIIVGIVGALLGGIVAGILFDFQLNEITLPSILIALLGSIILLALLRIMSQSEAV